jgi:Ca2+-binding RTX toxin-like protein
MANINGSIFNDNNLNGIPFADFIQGFGGGDVVHGNGGNDTIYGYSQSPDFWYFAEGGDLLYGDDGNDSIFGQNGNDYLNGGNGQDTFVGGLGADIFDFDSVSDSPAGGAVDQLYYFNWGQGDKIDLSTIDADLFLPGNQAFTSSQMTYNSANGMFTADVYGGSDLQIHMVGTQAGFLPFLDVIA